MYADKQGSMTMKSFDCDVVIPFWEGDIQYVQEAVESILHQTAVLPLIHVVADDELGEFSDPDGPFETKLRELPRGCHIRKYITKGRLGPSTIVNSIAKHYMETDYLAIQDADDLSFKERLYTQLTALSTTENVHSSCAMVQIPSKDYTGDRHIKEPVITCLSAPYKNMPRGKFINSTRMIRKSTFVELNGFPDMMVSGDLVLDNNLIYLGYPSICFNQPLAYRRVHNNSITHVEHYLRNNPGGKAAICEQMNYLYKIQISPTIETARNIGNLANAPELQAFYS